MALIISDMASRLSGLQPRFSTLLFQYTPFATDVDRFSCKPGEYMDKSDRLPPTISCTLIIPEVYNKTKEEYATAHTAAEGHRRCAMRSNEIIKTLNEKRTEDFSLRQVLEKRE